ncbi:alpha/beta hydrolase fold domain-containing protein [Ventrimonas sp. CLA-AP-H27]|uniref:Alpha/beta hydrolase fold domain-containing protein n=1 Tax=Ventrimonas faecis TaxID=3133170 RepID=A0ABV1HLU5_9FIRM
MVNVSEKSRNWALKTIETTVPVNLRSRIPEKCRDFLLRADKEIVEMPAICGYSWRLHILRARKREAGCPVHINIHGGGFFSGYKENDDMWSAWLADQMKGIVVSIDYSTTDERAAFPVAFEQCYESVKWVMEHCDNWNADRNYVSIGGYSAGANLTAAVCLKTAQTGDFKLQLQLLAYPPLDNCTPALMKPEGYVFDLSPERMEAYNLLYFGNDPDLAKNPYISPIYAGNEELAETPRALIISAGDCNFRYEDENYAGRLAALGVEVTVYRAPHAKHGFIPHFMEGWEEAADLIVRNILDAKGET